MTVRRQDPWVRRLASGTTAAWLGTSLVTAIVPGCGRAPVLSGRIAALEKIAEQAERDGARRCAPRELAMAQSHLKFARIELQQGSLSKASHHLWVAEPNAHAAQLLSPVEHCTEQGAPPVPAPKPMPGDRDGDGFLDPQDQCPDQPEVYNGVDDADGCPDDPDTDGDGILDSTDLCLLEPEDRDKYLDEDGCPEIDNDLDTVVDTADKCPLDPEDPDGFDDQDGCPEDDNDQDGVVDLEDQCPNEVGSADNTPKGCPSKPALVVVTDCEVKITQQIHFEYNKAVIRSESHPVLDAVLEVLEKNPEIKLEVQGHTDDRGSAGYNKRLSQQRADAVRTYLVKKGIPVERLTSKGYGFDRPLVPNTSNENRALNRRVQFIRTEGTKEGCPPTSGS